MPPPDFAFFETDLARLAGRFDKEFEAVSGPGYPEARLRDHYLNPLLRALGWDLENAAGLIQFRREIEIESRTDARDRFFCEANKPEFPSARAAPSRPSDVPSRKLQATSSRLAQTGLSGSVLAS